MRPSSLLLSLLIAHGGACHAAMLSGTERDELVSAVLKNFWGRAKRSNGEVIQPSSEAERNTVPVARGLVDRALDAGELSGLGEWCRLDWESNYFALTRAARNMRMTDTQVAFLSFLHGAAQGRIAAAMAKTSPCGEGERSKVQQLLEQSRALGLNGT